MRSEFNIIDKIYALRELQNKKDKHYLRYSAQESILEWVLSDYGDE